MPRYGLAGLVASSGGLVGAAAWSVAAGLPTSPSVAQDGPALGRVAAPVVIARMDLTVAGDGAGLPPGSGSVAEGRAIYEAKCSACHGVAGAGSGSGAETAMRLTGGVGSLASAKPVRTVTSYWPYAPSVFDYIRRAMPLNAPQSLSDRETYGVVAYLLSIDHIVAADATLDAASLARVRMPNRHGFVSLERDGYDGNVERGRDRRTASLGVSDRRR